MKTNFFAKNKITVTIISLLVVIVLGIYLTSSELRDKALGKWVVTFGDKFKNKENILDRYRCAQYVTREPGNSYRIIVRFRVNPSEQYPEIVNAKPISREEYHDLRESGYPIFDDPKVLSYDQCFNGYKFLTMDMYNEVSDKIEKLLGSEYDYDGKAYRSLRDWHVTKSVISKYVTGYDHPERHFKGVELSRMDYYGANDVYLEQVHSLRVLCSLGEYRKENSILGCYYRNSTKIKELESLDSTDFSKDTWYWKYKPWESALSGLSEVLEYLDQAMVVHYAINKSQIAEILKETFNTYDKDREYCLGLLNETMDMVSKNYEVIQYYV